MKVRYIFFVLVESIFSFDLEHPVACYLFLQILVTRLLNFSWWSTLTRVRLNFVQLDTLDMISRDFKFRVIPCSICFGHQHGFKRKDDSICLKLSKDLFFLTTLNLTRQWPWANFNPMSKNEEQSNYSNNWHNRIQRDNHCAVKTISWNLLQAWEHARVRSRSSLPS